ncbi:hypothetical protein FDP41_010026 [Naegleria fowleri]|uniref:Uncharacterized protein n=1 Tax=Naegleria fowleri TaxID=5763 RepID=A0A6A5ATY7_NAEFO|nr:uncharacterized protein FDP41_010026 [Naegleria fowleri]KAF0971803.1 hypothetical protein FDP41_010026 [Naegleria fowleri]
MGACGSRSEQKTNHPPSDMITIGGQKEEGYAQLDNDGELFFKILLLGDSGVGKSTILSMFSESKFNVNHVSTVGVDFKTVHLTVLNRPVQLQVWDTAGQERYRSIITAYYRGAHGILLTFDLTRRESYDNIRRWLLDVNKHAHQHTKTVLVGNKKDVDHMRNVTREEAEELARELGIKYFEVSAKTNDGIKEVFDDIAQQLIESM